MMSKKQAYLTTIMVVQQLEDEYWQSNDYKAALKSARDGNCRPLLEMIVQKLEKDGIKVTEAYIIKHDKDTISVWNEQEMKNILEDKTDHIHALLKLEKGASLNKIAMSINVEPQYLEKLKSGRYGYDNCLAYLVHAKDETKYQYKPEEVVTVLGENYTSVYHRNMETWVKGRATKKAKETALSVDWLIENILAGEITKSNILLTNQYYAIYGQHKRKINEALETAGERKSYQTIAELEAGKFKKTVIYIYADSGRGKTFFSKTIINILQRVAHKFGYRWDFCVTASTNAFDEYNGQDILFLDDIRGDSLTASDWLKLLDPYMISPISARYHNKMGSAKVIIITSTLNPMHFFQKAKGNDGEDVGQFIRRISHLIKIDKDYLIFSPVRQKLLSENHDKARNVLCRSSYEFKKIGQYKSNKATDKLVKLIIHNMNWNKQKKVINASDQTNNDNPITKQK